jgi:epidermal growth factor receptor substrate 15
MKKITFYTLLFTATVIPTTTSLATNSGEGEIQEELERFKSTLPSTPKKLESLAHSREGLSPFSDNIIKKRQENTYRLEKQKLLEDKEEKLRFEKAKRDREAEIARMEEHYRLRQEELNQQMKQNKLNGERVNSELAALRNQNAEYEERVKALVERKSIIETKLEEISKERADLAEEKNDLTKQNINLAKENAHLSESRQRNVESLNKELEDIEEQLIKERQEIKKLRQRSEELEHTNRLEKLRTESLEAEKAILLGNMDKEKEPVISSNRSIASLPETDFSDLHSPLDLQTLATSVDQIPSPALASNQSSTSVQLSTEEVEEEEFNSDDEIEGDLTGGLGKKNY